MQREANNKIAVCAIEKIDIDGYFYAYRNGLLVYISCLQLKKQYRRSEFCMNFLIYYLCHVPTGAIVTLFSSSFDFTRLTISSAPCVSP